MSLNVQLEVNCVLVGGQATVVVVSLEGIARCRHRRSVATAIDLDKPGTPCIQKKKKN